VTVEDLGFGEDYELLAATQEPLEFAVIGRCTDGEGVEIRQNGEHVGFGGWNHFGGQGDGDLR
jgi:thiamine monophosphate kinase